MTQEGFLALLRRRLFGSPWPLLALLCLAAFLLRHHRLMAEGLWDDEVYSTFGAAPDDDWGAFIARFERDPGHPLYYLLLRLWVRIFEWSDYWIRLFSVVTSVTVIPGMFLLGRLLRGDRCGWIAAILAAVNYFFIFHGQEARPYSLMAATATWSYVFYLRYLTTLRRGDLIGYAAATVLMLSSQAFAALVVAAQFAYTMWLFAHAERRLRILLFKVTFGLGVLFGAVWIGLAAWLLPLRAKTGGAHMATAPGSDFVFKYALEFFGNDVLLALAIGLLGVGALLVHFRPGATAPATGSGLAVRPLSYVALSVLFLTLVPYLVSILAQPVLFPRWYIYLVPLYIVMAAYGAAALLNAAGATVVTATLVALSLVTLTHWNNFYRKPKGDQPREIIGFIVAHAHLTDRQRNVYFFTNVVQGVTYYTGRAGKKWQWIAGYDIERLKALRERATEPFGVWVVSSIWPVHPPFKQELDTHFKLESTASFSWNGSATFYSYTPTAR